MMTGLLLQLIGLTLLYVLSFVILARVLRVGGISVKYAFVGAGAIFGILTGLLAAWIWPLDSVVLPNLYAVLLGDALYQAAIVTLGNPGSNRAHMTIPWLLRVPQLYVPVSIASSLLVGGVVQWTLNRKLAARQAAGRTDHP